MASIARQNNDLECPKCAGQLRQVKMTSIGLNRSKLITINQCATCHWYYII